MEKCRLCGFGEGSRELGWQCGKEDTGMWGKSHLPGDFMWTRMGPNLKEEGVDIEA
jgi:hypothetical protein